MDGCLLCVKEEGRKLAVRSVGCCCLDNAEDGNERITSRGVFNIIDVMW